MEVLPLTLQLEKEWEAYVSARPGAGPAHALGWRNVVVRTYGHVPCHLLVRDRGQVRGVLPLFLIRHPLFGRSLVSAPFLSHGGICADEEDAARALINAARSLCWDERARYVEVRNLQAVGHGLRLKDCYCVYLLSLDPDPEVIWARFEPHRARTATRKATRFGLVVERGAHLLDTFVAVAAQQMRDLGTPFHSRFFYRTILEEFPGEAEIFTVRRRGQVLGGGLTVTVRDTLHWIYGGCLNSSREVAANSLLTWEIIRFACLQKLTWLDFGRSRWNSGTAHYKQQWAAHAVPLFYEYQLSEGVQMPDMDPTNPRFRLSIAIWRRLPVTIARCLGPFVIRGIP